ncbi:MAG: hypothetical protein RLZZ618_2375 [Pseudomonadota bacterium]
MLQLSKTHWYAIAAAAVVAAVAASYLSGSGDSAGGGGAVATTTGTAPSMGAGQAPASSASNAEAGSSPFSITTATGKLDAALLFDLSYGGGLVVDRATRSSIEALINNMPENPSADDIARLERALREGMPREEAEKALKLFKDYRAYTQEIQREMLPKGIPTTLQEANLFFDQMEAVKRRHFDGPTAEALFGQQDEHARLTMEAMFVQQDANLTPEQKTQRLDELRAKLPADQRSLIPKAEPAAPPASQPAS